MSISRRTLLSFFIVVSIWVSLAALVPLRGFSEQPIGNSLTSWVSLGPSGANISDIAFDPFNTDTIYAGATGLITLPNVGVLKTSDGGANWITMNNGLPPFGTIHLAIDEEEPSTIYAGVFDQGIFKSTNSAAIWTPINSGLNNTGVTSIAIDPLSNTTLYVGTFGGVFKSTDAGASWNAANVGLTNTAVFALVIDPAHTERIYVGTSGGGVFKSTDAGGTWIPINGGITNNFVLALAIDPIDTDRIYAGTNAGIFKSNNGGLSWTAVNNGLTNTQVFTISIDPDNSSRLFLGTLGGFNGGVFVSFDAGASWTSFNDGLAASNIRVLRFGAGGNRIYAGTDGQGIFVADVGVPPPSPTPTPTPTARTPVLIIPGVYGTTLEKGTELLWLDAQRVFDSRTDSFLDPLAFTDILTPLDNSIRAGDVIRQISWEQFGNLKTYDYMEGLLGEFEGKGYTERTDLFFFPYDWRFGISDNVIGSLRTEIRRILTQTNHTKLHVIAHSTGGLLIKRYLQTTNEQTVDKLVFLGVPHIGAPKAVNVLLTGDIDGKTGLGFARTEMKMLARNMPIVYDLLPSIGYYLGNGSFLHIRFPDGTTTDLDYLQARSLLVDTRGGHGQAFDNAIALHTFEFDNLDLRTRGADVYNIVGCGKGDDNKGTIAGVTEQRFLLGSPTYSVLYSAGDGTVPLVSALNTPADESKIFFAVHAEHGKLPSQSHIRAQLVKIILGDRSATPNIYQGIGCTVTGRPVI